MKKLLILSFLLASLPFLCEAEVKLPALVSDGMVLQRDQNIRIWGSADAGEKINISFLKKKHATTADASGKWTVTLPPAKAGGPYIMTINEIEVKDILVGDVWLCSGQSNMELPINRVMDMFRDEVEAYNNPMIRHIKVPLSYDFHQPKTDINNTSWKALTAQNALQFSAVAYFFAKDLFETNKVPIGLINASVGGSPAEAWISEEGLKHFPAYLSERDICRSDSYVENVKNLERERRNLWVNVLNKQDAGLSENIKWSSLNYDDSAWTTFDLFDKTWGSDGLNPINGSHWFRKELNIPQHLASKSAVLRLGCIMDADSVFVNGIFVGTISYQYPPRIYQVPENLLKEGKNVISIRLISYSGFPEFVKDKPYKLLFDKEEISLTGDWRYKQGNQMPALPGETFFHYKPIGLYNAMIAPLQNYALKGVLWYQGESNTGKHNEYYDLMTSLIGDWRKLWKQVDLPFLIVQLANFMQDPPYPSESGWAELRNQQLRLSQTIPNTALAVTIDIGEWNDIHPLNKKEVGRRLSLQAQRIAYGDSKTIAEGPIYQSMLIDGDKIILSFKEGTNEFGTIDELKGFAIAGEDGQFKWAKAVVENNKVVVWNSEIKNPVKVRYAWRNNPTEANLKNSAGSPASPFEAEQPIITKNEIGVYDGLDYELWHDIGDISMTVDLGGAFECSWDNINNALFRTGKKFDSTKTHEQIGKISLAYDSDYRPNGNSYLCVYGWSIDPLIEFYIVEAWGSWRPPGAEAKATIKVDGGIYDIYETTRVEQPSIQGNTTFRQYWSVRRDKKTSGNISISEHFKAWEKLGMKLGKLYEVSFCVEGYQSSGSAKVHTNKLNIVPSKLNTKN